MELREREGTILSTLVFKNRIFRVAKFLNLLEHACTSTFFLLALAVPLAITVAAALAPCRRLRCFFVLLPALVSPPPPPPTMRWFVLLVCLLAVVRDVYVLKLVLMKVVDSFTDSIQQRLVPLPLLWLGRRLFGGGNLGFLFVSIHIREHIQSRKRQELKYNRCKLEDIVVFSAYVLVSIA